MGRQEVTTEELNREYPGDDMLPEPKGVYMHAISINARPGDIWPWLVQLGQGRGGFYSYEFLENLIGCKIKNAESIIPELQNLKVGDKIPMHPTMGSPYIVAEIVPEHTLLLELRVDTKTQKTFELNDNFPEKYQNQSWLLLLEEKSDSTTRLISRSRNEWNDSIGNSIFYGIFGSITMEMDRKMLLEIKKRVEASRS